MQLYDPETFRAHATGLVRSLDKKEVAFPVKPDFLVAEGESFEDRSLLLAGGGKLPDLEDVPPEEIPKLMTLRKKIEAKHEALQAVADPLAGARKFACPDSRHLPKKDEVRRGAHMLPFPRTYLETSDGHNLLLLTPEEAEEVGIAFDETLPEEYAVVVPFHNSSAYPGPELDVQFVYVGFCAAFYAADETLHAVSGNLGPRIGLGGHGDIVEENMRWAVTTAARVLTLLNCSNIGRTELRANIPHNVKNRKDRFSYDVLVVRTNTTNPSFTEGEPLSEEQRRASPRLHFRRGHIRNNADGTQTWVRPCMVGDPDEGTVVKDYDVRASED